ncbi:Nascent polypeptide-associated complex subunit alpha, muscle-specific form [Rhizoctonia solani]|uniref:Nascent polypeptide-associated complex subunit alpha, muscle-specific form n=1 Tax=Rhizoctonia solani TaxID=456999 RepID=A0A0K6FNM6_9AGAM|nr:Nascent polypeptide-associated complex subunit alpha, muscle-specific form [Rhizoctonia solani]
MDPDLARRFQPRVALVAPDSPRRSTEPEPIRPPRAAPPPRPPRLSSPPPKNSPSTSFRSLADNAKLAPAPAPMTRGNSEYSIVAVSESSTERVTPQEEGSLHRREVADDRGYFSPLDDDDDPDETNTRPTRSGTITSRSTRTHTTTPSVTSITPSSHSHYTQSSKSHYTQSSKSHYTAPSRDASEEMLDLIATVGSALSDMTLDPSEDDDKPSRAKSPTPNHYDTIREFRHSPRASLADFSRVSSARNSPKPSLSDLARASPKPSVSEFPREYVDARSPEKHRLRDLSPEKPRDPSPEKPRPRQVSPGSGSVSSKSRVEQVLSHSVRSASPHARTGSGSASPIARTLAESRTTESSRNTNENRVSPPPRSVPMITRSSCEQHSELSSPHSPRSSRHPTSPRSIHPTNPDLKFRQPGSALPESFYFAEVLRMKSSSERAQGYTRKINQLAAEDSGLGYWVGFMKGRVKPSLEPPSSGPTSPNLLTTFGPHGPGTRRQPQPRHVSGGSVGSEVTFAVRPDAYVATNISIRSNSPPLSGTPPALPYPSLAKDIGIRAVEPRTPSSSTSAVPTPGMKAKVGSIGLFSHIGRKSSVRRERDRLVMQQARKPHVLRTGSNGPSPGAGYADLPAPSKPVSLSTPPTIPGGPRARTDKRAIGDAASDSGHSYSHSYSHTLEPHPRASVIMIGGRDSFQTMSPSGDGRPVSIRVPSSNGHGVITPTFPPTSPNSSMFGSPSGMRSPEPPSSFRAEREGSVYSRESYRDRGSRASSALGHGNGNGHGTGNLEQLVDVLPHVDRAVLQGYLDRANGHEIDAISAYLEDESRMNGSVGHEYG